MPYYIGDKRLITLMMKLDCDVAVMTLDDLENFYIKRSYIRKDIEYVYAFHHMTSTHLVCTKEAFDHYDTGSVRGPASEGGARTGRGDAGYPSSQSRGMRLRPARIGQIAAYESRKAAKAAEGAGSRRPVVLVAPSWQEDCLLDLCADEVLEPLLGRRVQRDRASASRVHQALSRPVGVAAAALRVVVARRHLLRAGLQHVRFGLRCRRAGHRLVLHRLRVLLHHDEAVRVRGTRP